MLIQPSLIAAFSGMVASLQLLAQPDLQPHQSIQPGATLQIQGNSRPPGPTPCPENLNSGEMEPIEAGPAHLVEVHCIYLTSRNSYSGRTVSPDGRAMASWGSGLESLLNLVWFDGTSAVEVSNRVAFRMFGRSVQERPSAIAWRSDSSGVWTVEQSVVHPNGWAVSGLRPLLINRDRSVRRFEPPRHPAGPLDGIAWAGGRGRAIAEYGTRGTYYRPAHDDPSPTLAMIDVPRGRVLDSLTSGDLEPLGLNTSSVSGFRGFEVSAVELRNGRLRALLQFARVGEPLASLVTGQGAEEAIYRPATWLVWTQGQTPVALKPPFDDRLARAELSADGSRILVWRPVQPDGIRTEDCHDCPPPPPPTPVTAVAASVVDARSGRTMWSLQVRAGAFWRSSSGPVISPDGRYALIPIPDAARNKLLALVSMADGRIVQRFSLGCAGCVPPSFGFARDGHQIWMGISGTLAIYALN